MLRDEINGPCVAMELVCLAYRHACLSKRPHSNRSREAFQGGYRIDEHTRSEIWEINSLAGDTVSLL